MWPNRDGFACSVERIGVASLGSSCDVHAGLSTISVELAKRMKKEHARRGREYVGAPMFGRPEAAREAKLLIVTGGAPSSISKLQPIFRAIGRLSFTAGAEPWHANLFKLCGNFMISSMLETFGEAQALIRKAGLEPNEFVQLMAEFWGSAVYCNYGTLIVTGMYAPPGATLALGLKDNRLLLNVASELSVPLPVASLVRDQMLAAIAAGNAELDWSSLTNTALQNAGLTPKRI
jgi:3-hydroxyisobutyrate dehydrogenase-like beta-hydroxyacid dehydrogenase